MSVKVCISYFDIGNNIKVEIKAIPIESKLKIEMKICKTKMEMEFLCGNGNKNGIVFSGGTHVETELFVSVNMEFLFLL